MLDRHDAIEEVYVQIEGHELHGSLGMPQGPVGIVIVASARDDPRVAEAHVAEQLRARGLATLVVDLVAEPRGERHEVDLLARRLVAVTSWVVDHSSASHLPLGYFAGGTAAAAALVAAAREPDVVRAIALADGRADLAGASLPLVRTPTLLVAPGSHESGIEIDRAAIEAMTTSTQLAILPGAGPTFEEPGALDDLVQLCTEWFVDHFADALGGSASQRGSWGRQFRDRRSAGERLARALCPHAGPGTCVFGLPRGGVVVAAELARTLDAPLDVWLVRKIGMPFQPELGMGTLAEGAALVLDPTSVRWSGVTAEELRAIVHRQADEIRRRARLYRGHAPAPDVRGKTVILVDDGIATGGGLCAAVRGARRRGAARVLVAAPVAAAEAIEAIEREADELVCLSTPRHLVSIGAWYQDFRQPPEQDVVALLDDARVRFAHRRNASARV